MKAEQWDKLTRLQFLLSAIIVLRHCDISKSIFPILGKHGYIGYLLKFITDLTNIAVPSFFIISGVLLFRHFSVDMPYNNVFQLNRFQLKKRIKSLVIPFFIWNALSWLFYATCTHLPIISSLMNMEPVSLKIVNIVYDIIMTKYTPLWFVRVLFIYVCMSGILFFILRNKYMFMLVTSIFVILQFTDLPIKHYFILYGLPFFLIGGFIGLHYWNRFTSWKGIGFGKKIFLLSFSIVMILFYEYTVLYPFLYAFCIASSILFCATMIFNNRDVVLYPWYKYSFYIYCSHFIHINIFQKVYLVIFGKSVSSYIVSWLGVAILTIAVCCCEACIIKRYLPKMYVVITGNR